MNSKNINTVKLPADEKLLLDIQRREKAILDERSAINFAENTGIAKGKIEGKIERDNELIEKWRKKGYTESQIKELLS